MTNKKTTKKALLASLLSLVLCCAMLIGTTFAWFTDSVTSGNNRIVAGNLDVDLLMYKDNDYVSIADGTGDIFDEATVAQNSNKTLWEPGKTQIVYLAVENKGSLALQYDIAIDVTDNGLVGALEYALVDGVQAGELTVTSWEDVKASGAQIGDVVEGKTKAENGCLDEIVNGVANERDYFALAVHMKEEAGNEYQGKDIVIDVNVLATQVEAESDSFNNQYDAGLKPLEDGEVLVEEDGIQYVYTDDELVLYLVTDAYTKDTVVVKEGVTTIGNYSFAYNNNVKNVILSSSVRDLGRGFDSSSVEHVTLNEGLETISSRAFRRTYDLKSVTISSTVTTIVENAFQSCGITEIVIPENVTSIGFAAFTDCENLKKVTIEADAAYIASYAFRDCPALETVIILGEKATFGAGSMVFAKTQGGVCDGITVYVANETVKKNLESASGSCTNLTIVTTGIVKDSAKHFTVTSKSGLMKLGDALVAASPSEANILTVDLLCDVDLSGETWDPINSMWIIFNGNGHTISNVNCTRDDYVGRSGFWGYAGAVTINDLTLENVTTCGTQVGTFAGAAEGLKLNNCYLKGTNKVTWEQNPAGSAYFETWNGIGAITGVTQASTINVEITKGTTVTLNTNGITSEAPYVDELTGYIAANNGTVVNNGTVTVK